MKIFFLAFLFIFSSITSYSQPFGNFTNSLSVLKTQSGNRWGLISARIGYHTESDKTLYNGFGGGMIYSLSFDVALSSAASFGVSFDYWNHTNEDYNIAIYGNISSTNRGANINLNILRRFTGKYNSFNIGIGLGLYFLKVNQSSDQQYYNVKLISSADIRFFSDDVFLSPQVEYNYMLNFAPPHGMFCFKIGPSFRF
jgi:hypothetical protein